LIVNLDLNKIALRKLKELAAVKPKQYYTARATDTGVVIRDITIKEF
jgi:hypothetical protein